MNKYYTPEIEEFHEGFDFEVDWSKDEGWDDQTYSLHDIHLIDIENALDLDKIRVKYLDREDIESFGFKQVHYDQFEKNYYEKDGLVFGLEFGEEGEIHIHHTVRERVYVLFNGKIKNKSEFKRILKQIGVI